MTTTTRVTQEIAAILRGELARAQRNQTWFGTIIGVTQSQASKILRGQKPMTLDQLQAACDVFGLHLSDVVRNAEQSAPPETGVTAQLDRALRVDGTTKADKLELQDEVIRDFKNNSGTER